MQRKESFLSRQHLNLTLTNVGGQKPAEDVPHDVSADEKGCHNASIAGARKHDNLQNSANCNENACKRKNEGVEAARSVHCAERIGDRSGEPSKSERNHCNNCWKAPNNNKNH